jgi:hypothetical protein
MHAAKGIASDALNVSLTPRITGVATIFLSFRSFQLKRGMNRFTVLEQNWLILEM